jgi:hypothetical protein
MANSHREDRRSYRQRASDNEWANEHAGHSSGKGRVTLDSVPEIPGVRRIRVERRDEDRDAGTRKTSSPRRMKTESHATLPSDESMSSHRRRRREYRNPDEEAYCRRATVSRDESPATHPHGTPSKTSYHTRAAQSVSRRVESSEEETSESEEEVVRRSETKRKSPSKRKVRVVYITEEEYHSSKQKDRAQKGERKPAISAREDDVVRRSRTHRPQRRSVAEPVDSSPPKR